MPNDRGYRRAGKIDRGKQKYSCRHSFQLIVIKISTVCKLKLSSKENCTEGDNKKHSA